MNSDAYNNIAILGGGVSGITTGIILQILGYQTKIFTRERADRPVDAGDPAFASLYPSASIIPHSVSGNGISDYFEDSHKIFGSLLRSGFPGISVNVHYEVFEFPMESPFYAVYVDRFSRIDPRGKRDPEVPKPTAEGPRYGWKFDCFFADWPIYLPRLFRWYQELGGTIVIRKITPETLEQFDEPVINCTGIGSLELFEDHRSHSVLKGHLVKVAGAPNIKGRSGKTISYNYNPVPRKYPDELGNGQDVYCYPRTDGWILGGSRLSGTVNPDGSHTLTSPGVPLIEISGVGVPSPVINLNREILSETFGITLDDYPRKKAVAGFRYTRDESNGLRLEQAIENEKRVIHNYGHGGAGVTLSWGCALQVARWIEREAPKNPSPRTPDPLSSHLYEILSQLG